MHKLVNSERRKTLALLASATASAVLASVPSLAATPQLPSPLKRMITDASWNDRPRDPMPLLDAEGQMTNMTDFQGRFVLLNIWATWCYPCRVEMPDLDELQTKFDPKEMLIMPVSIDRKGRKAVRSFYERSEITNLNLYSTTGFAAVNTFGERAIPFTILLDPKGKEIARFLGAVRWTAEDFVGFLNEKISAWNKQIS